MAKKKKLKVTIEVVPTQGRTTKKTIKVDSGSSLQEVLKAAGISGTSKNLLLMALHVNSHEVNERDMGKFFV